MRNVNEECKKLNRTPYDERVKQHGSFWVCGGGDLVREAIMILYLAPKNDKEKVIFGSSHTPPNWHLIFDVSLKIIHLSMSMFVLLTIWVFIPCLPPPPYSLDFSHNWLGSWDPLHFFFTSNLSVFFFNLNTVVEK